MTDVDIDFRTTSLADIAKAVRTKQISARELTQESLDRIQRYDPTYNAFVAVDGEKALTDAKALDDRIAAGEDPGPLAGIPLAVKDLQDLAGYTTTFGSALHQDDPPPTSTAPSWPGSEPPDVSPWARPTHPSSAGWATRPTTSSAPP